MSCKPLTRILKCAIPLCQHHLLAKNGKRPSHLPLRTVSQQMYFSTQTKKLSQSPFVNPRGESVKKTKMLGLYLLLAGTVLITPFGLNARIHRPTVQPMVLSSLEGVQWVKKCIERHPEISWLADNNVRITQEGQASKEASYSVQIYGKDYPEFNRTILSLYFLRLALDGSDAAYAQFTAAQPIELRLPRGRFHELHLEGQRLLKSGWGGLTELQMADVMEAALVLGDIGKSQIAREIFKEVTDPDHDDFHNKAMQILEKHPELCPSFARLPAAGKKLLIQIAKINTHYGHITHIEGRRSMFTPLKESGIAETDPLLIDLDLYVYTWDVAAALGHVKFTTSLVYHKQCDQAMQAMKRAVHVLADPTKTEQDALDSIVTEHASWIGLDPKDKYDRVLARVAAMMRLFTPEEGAILRKAMLEMSPEMRDRIVQQFDVSGENITKNELTDTYIPAVLVNLLNNPALGKTREERLSKAIFLGLPFLTIVLEKYKKPESRLDFNDIAGVAKTSPASLSKEAFVDKEGRVHIAAD